MKFLILGATGKAGRIVTAEALARGHEVVGFVHTTVPPEQAGLRIVHGDVHNPDDINKALTGCDAVISCLSSWGTPKKDVLSSAMQYVIPAMTTAGITRIVTLTGNIALLPHEQVNWFLRAMHSMLVIAAPRVASDAESHLRLLAESELTWTSVRSPVMVNGPGRPYRLTNTVSLLGTISRHSLAAAMIDLAESNEWSHEAPIIRKK